MLTLTVIEGPDAGKRFELPDDEPQLIGRSSEALPLGDTTVSRRHAELTPDRGEWYLRDLSSQNGTFVNGLPVTARLRLEPGDEIRTGATVIRFGPPPQGESSVISLMGPQALDAEIEQRLPSIDPLADSVLLAEPEPRIAAYDHLRIIYALVSLTAQKTDRQQLLAGVLELVFTEFKPQRGFILLTPDTPGEAPRPAVVKYAARPKDKDEARFRVSQTILTHALRMGEGVLSSNAMSDPRFAAGDSVQRLAIRSAICSPIRFRERTFGAIYIDSSIANYTFTTEQLALMNAIGQHTGLALANAELLAEKLQAERLAAVGETVASLSHSIKNILQGLRGGADVMEMGLKRKDLGVATNGWEILKRNLDRIVGLTMNMLTFSRQRQMEYELTRIAPLLEDCAQLMEPACAAKNIPLIVDADPEMPPIPIDPSLLHQAMMNLMGNAVEAVEAGTGVVTVTARYREPKKTGTLPWVEIAVIDNGPGIPPDRMKWIFEPFHTTKGLRGTGLGLAVTKRIIAEHGGRIRVESEPGKGATFRVALPADIPASGDPSKTTATRLLPEQLLGEEP